MSALEAIAAKGGTTVEYQQVGRVYGNMAALAGLNLKIEPDELLALLGLCEHVKKKAQQLSGG